VSEQSHTLTPKKLSTVTESVLRRELHELSGPLLGGEELRRALGFRSAASFERAVRLRTLALKIFTLESRRGRFALTADVAAWLFAQSQKDAVTGKQETHAPINNAATGKEA